MDESRVSSASDSLPIIHSDGGVLSSSKDEDAVEDSSQVSIVSAAHFPLFNDRFLNLFSCVPGRLTMSIKSKYKCTIAKNKNPPNKLPSYSFLETGKIKSSCWDPC